MVGAWQRCCKDSRGRVVGVADVREDLIKDHCLGFTMSFDSSAKKAMGRCLAKTAIYFKHHILFLFTSNIIIFKKKPLNVNWLYKQGAPYIDFFM